MSKTTGNTGPKTRDKQCDKQCSTVNNREFLSYSNVIRMNRSTITITGKWVKATAFYFQIHHHVSKAVGMFVSPSASLSVLWRYDIHICA